MTGVAGFDDATEEGSVSIVPVIGATKDLGHLDMAE